MTASSSRITTHAEAATRFGQRLKALRKQAGLTQEDLGRRAGYVRSGIQQLEAGRKGQRPVNPTLEALVTLAGALGVNPYQLLAPTHDENRSEAESPSQSERDDDGDRWGSAGEVVRGKIQDELADGAWHERAGVVRRAAIAVPPGVAWRAAGEGREVQEDRQIMTGAKAFAADVIEDEIGLGKLLQRGQRLRARAR
jgi:transcriptional regulator with XRE-family HTH domain